MMLGISGDFPILCKTESPRMLAGARPSRTSRPYPLQKTRSGSQNTKRETAHLRERWGTIPSLEFRENWTARPRPV